MNVFKKKSSCAIGIIGGSDGPTSIFISSKQKSKETIHQIEFLNFAATQVVADFRPFAGINEFLLIKYKAIPYDLPKKELRGLKANVIINNFRDLLDLPAPLPKNPTKEQLIEYAKNDTTFKQARNYPAEKLGLILKAYKIPSATGKDGIVELEMTTEYMTINNTSKEVAYELLLWQGISQDDIDHQTPRFITHVNMLRELGRLKPTK